MGSKKKRGQEKRYLQEVNKRSSLLLDQMYPMIVETVQDFRGVDAIFNIQNVADYFFSVERTLADAPTFLESVFSFFPPFKNTWFEADYGSAGLKASHGAIRVQNLCGILLQRYSEDRVIMYIYVITMGTSTCLGRIIIRIDPKTGKGLGFVGEMAPHLPPESVADFMAERYGMADVERLGQKELVLLFLLAGAGMVVLTALNFLHCKNIKVIRNEFSEEEQVMRHSKTRPCFEEYHTIEIDPLKKILNGEGNAQTVGFKKALHFVRGHFHEYGESAPLFGKYVGRFWIPDHKRGSIDVGRIDKDYVVKAPCA